MLGLVFLVVPIICLHRALYKIHSWKLFVYGKIFAHGKIKSGRKSLVKRKEKESRPKEERKSSILSRKEKIFLHADVQISNKEVPVEPKFANTLLKMRFPFLYSSASLDAKTWTIASNIVILKAVCRFVVLLLSTFSGFSIPGCLFFLCLWQLCSILCRPPQRSTKRSRWKKKTRVCNGLLFLGIG